MKLVSTGQITIVDSNDYYPQLNLLDWVNEWIPGSDYLPNWNRAGLSTENIREYGPNPWGINALLWKCAASGDNNADGGWDTNAKQLNQNYAYRYCVFVKKNKSGGYVYHGVQNVDNMDGSANVNPYFMSVFNPPTFNEWYLMVGVIHPSTVTTATAISGLYDMKGKKVASLTVNEFRFKPGVNPTFRSYLFYSSDNTVVQYFYCPMLHRLDGTEPSLDEILRISSDTVKEDIKASLTISEGKIGLLGKEINLDGMVNFNSLTPAAKNTIDTNAQVKVDAVQIGGRNLLKATEFKDVSKWFYLTTVNFDSVSGYNYVIVPSTWSILQYCKTISGQVYTFSFYARNTATTSVNFVLKFDTENQGVYISIPANTTTWTRFKIQITALQTINQAIYLKTTVAGSIFDLALPQLEIGNKVTDYKPAPEDTQADIDTAQSTANNAKAYTDALAVDSKVTPDEKQRLYQEWNLIQTEATATTGKIPATAISFGVSTAAFDSAYNTLNSYLNQSLHVFDNLTTTTDIGSRSLWRTYWSNYYNAKLDIQNAISVKSKTLIDGLRSDLGGRNLMSQIPAVTVYNTPAHFYPNFAAGKNTKAHKILNETATGTYRFMLNGLKSTVAGYYTLSFWWKHSDGGGFNLHPQMNDVEFPQFCYENNVENTWKYYSSTVYVNSFLGQPAWIDFEVIGGNWFEFYISDIKLEAGSVATPWTAHQEDLAALQLLNSAFGGSTQVDGGLVLTNILEVKDKFGNVTGGLVGINDETPASNVAAFYGGTLQDAIDSENDPSKIPGIDRKDGSGHKAKGNFLWNKLGDILLSALFRTALSGARIEINNKTNSITIFDASEKAQMLIKPTRVRTVAELTGSGTVTSTYTAHTLTITQADSLWDQYLGANESIQLTANKAYDITTPAISYTASVTPAQNAARAEIIVSLYNITKGAIVAELGYAVASSSQVGVNNAISGTVPVKTIKGISIGSANESFKVLVQVVISGDGTMSAHAEVAAGETIRGVLIENYSEIGLNGMNLMNSSSSYVHYDENGYEVKGPVNMSGFLASGSISWACARSNQCGAKNSSSSVTKGDGVNTTGIYNVPHAAGSEYSVQVTSASDNLKAAVVSQGTNTFRVTIRSQSGALTDGGFNYAIFGNN